MQISPTLNSLRLSFNCGSAYRHALVPRLLVLPDGGSSKRKYISTTMASSAFSSASPSLQTSSSPQKQLDHIIFQRLNPRAYLEKFFAENIRPDGREFGEWRNVNVNLGRYDVPFGQVDSFLSNFFPFIRLYNYRRWVCLGQNGKHYCRLRGQS